MTKASPEYWLYDIRIDDLRKLNADQIVRFAASRKITAPVHSAEFDAQMIKGGIVIR